MPFSPTTLDDARIDDLIGALRRVPDPRALRGVRYPLESVLAVTAGAVLSGARSFAAIGEWGTDLTSEQLTRLGLRCAPDESTLRKLFARIDAQALDHAMARVAWTRTGDSPGRRVIAIDGKSLRGARTTTGPAPHLVAAVDHREGIVLGQLAISAKSNEIPAVRNLLASFDPAELHGAVITIDAMHTQDETAQVIIDAGADYVFTVKGNRPALHKALKKLPWNEAPAGATSTEKGHGRRVTRTIKVLDALRYPEWPRFPGAAQVAQIRRTVTRAGRKSVEVVYIITSADFRAARPEILAAWVQDHWTIENRLHWVRDVTFDEDRSQVRTGVLPQIMATLRNTRITLLRLAGWDNIAAALRHHARHPDHAIDLLT